MPTPSAKRALPAIAGTDTPDVPRDVNALITALEAEVGYLATRTVLEVGQVGQTRAGRVLVLADFTDLGLTAPVALHSLGNLLDTSGNARDLTNKGAVPFTTGVTGAASEAALFVGSTAQALYRLDTGAADPFRIRTGSWGCWFRTAKRGVQQTLVSKSAAALLSYEVHVNSSNMLAGFVTSDGSTAPGFFGYTDVADDRWHFAIITYDGTTARLYLDGSLEGQSSGIMGTLFQGAAPFNIGGRGADAGTVATNPHFGRVDEAFVTPDVLSEDQIRLLYALKIPHAAPRTPRRAGVAVRRRRRGATLVSGDFPTAPLRYYAMNNGVGDIGGVALADTGGSLQVAGADGTRDHGRSFDGVDDFLSATDTGLPAGAVAKSFGMWFSVAPGQAALTYVLLSYGNQDLIATAQQAGIEGVLTVAGTSTGIAISDGKWHHVVVSEGALGDGTNTRVYLDGKLIDSRTSGPTNVTLAGAARFRVGAGQGVAAVNFAKAIADGVFVTNYALTSPEVQVLYQKSGQDLGLSPKNSGDHVERIDATNAHFIGDTLDSNAQVDLEVAA